MKKTSKESLQVSKLLGTWLREYLPAQKNVSPNTIESYTYALSLFLHFLETKASLTFESLTFDAFSKENIQEYLKWLRTVRNCCPASCNIRLAAVRSFLHYAAGECITMAQYYQYSSLIPRMKEESKPVSYLSKVAIQNLFAQPDQKTRIGRRDLSLMVMLYDSALRIDELLSLKIADLRLDLDVTIVTIIGKGKKIRTVPLMKRTMMHISKYIKEFHGVNPNPQAYLFYSRNNGLMAKLSQDAVALRLKKYSRMACLVSNEVPPNVHCHQLRHSRATHLLQDGVQVAPISRLLGHADLNTTMVYAIASIEMITEALASVEGAVLNRQPKKWKDSKTLAKLCNLREIKRKALN